MLQQSIKEEILENPQQESRASDKHETEDAQQAKTLENVVAALPEAKEENSDEQDEHLIPQTELVAKTEELQVLNDKYLRLAAEFENYKRRTQRDQGDTVRFANEKLLRDLLPTIDNLERALQCSTEQADSEGFLQGVELTYKQFFDTLEKLGVSQVTSVGEPFDPTKHQAVGQVESSTIAENCVVDEYQKGYFLQDRILRPAMVTVSRAATAKDSAAPSEDESIE